MAKIKFVDLPQHGWICHSFFVCLAEGKYTNLISGTVAPQIGERLDCLGGYIARVG